MTKCNALPGIKNVWYIDVDNLPDDVVYRNVAGIPVSLSAVPVEITLKGNAVCEVDEQEENNSQSQKAKLTFSTLDNIPTGQDLAFLLKTIDGNIYIIGEKERPFPTVKVSDTSGRPEGDPAVKKYEVTFSAKKVLAPVTA